jgi:hypothetical protein
MAYELGFKVPDTVMGNHAALAKQCVERHETLAIKPVFNGLMELELTFRQKIAKFLYELKHGGNAQKEPYQSTIAVLTQCFARNQAQPYMDLLPECPVIVQEYVPKKLELRVTVVGDQIFPCAIHSQDSHLENRSDWRNDVYDCRHESYALPPCVEAKCFELVRRLGVHFGCIDLIVTPDDEYVFLEINPNGQWRWVQELTGMPIAEAIAELLINRKLCNI